ncbi:MAG: V-type ATP synthase subunit E family protein [Desulfurococcaceae archaeon]
MSDEARAKILEEAKKKANEIIEEARKTAESIIKEAEERWRRKAEAERDKILFEANSQASAIIAEARKTSRFVIGEAKLNVIEHLYETIYDRIKKGDYNVEASLRSLLRESLDYVEKPVKVIVRKDQVSILQKILVELGHGNVEIEGSDDILGGLVLISEEGTLVDNRLETRLKQSREKLLSIIAKTLFGEN